MINDNIYYWEGIGSTYPRKLLGECQFGENGMNMSFVIDGTKDSTKLIVFSYTESQIIKPNSIVWHKNTDTYWIVSDDKVERYANESGWYYKHSLQLEGAISLLNARDLTDCGFNQKTYTIENFTKRLFKLSTFEIYVGNIAINFGNNIDKDKIVDYIKTFENYTLLSALRELYDGYNCSLKLSFYQYGGDPYYLASCKIDIIPKTGNIDRDVLNIDDVFNEIKEIKTLNKNSYGTTVVSNAENIVSTKSKLYPSVGYIRISGENYIITPNDAVLRLPSKVSSVEYVDMLKGKVTITIGRNEDNYYDTYMNETIVGSTTFDTTSVKSFNAAIDWIKNKLLTDTGASANWVNNYTDDDFWNDAKGQSSLETFNEYVGMRFYNIENYDPINNVFVSDHTINRFNRIPDGVKPYVLANKEIRDGVLEPNEVMYWERGSNLIKGFNFFNWFGVSNQITSNTEQGVIFVSFTQTYGNRTYHYTIIFGNYTTSQNVAGYISPTATQFNLLDTYFRVKYVPMGDLKIKYDNISYGKDIQLYNQTGKLIDGVALSKLLVSYKENIISDNITRYKIGYSFSDMPKAGDIIDANGEKYVINNVSLDFYQNENDEDMCYLIVGEYTMSKNIATKSLLTNPNTNIRDYGIPQNYNVKRKQLYRDFYELSYTYDDNADNSSYMGLENILHLENYKVDYDGHTAVMKMQYSHSFGGGGGTYDGGVAPSSNVWYYQLDSTIFYFKKSMYEVVDFQDNNIIGYDCQNVTCGFDVRRLFDVIQIGSADIDTINTPISYVDDRGKIEGITIEMCNNEQLVGIYNEYIEEKEQQLGQTYNGTLYNRCVFIPQEIFDKAKLSANHDYEIEETLYDKDALEVPVIEYSCQIDDTEDVVIGENIIEYENDDLRYFYEFIFVENGKVNNNNWTKYFTPKDITFANNTFTLDDSLENNRKCARFLISGATLMVLYAYNSIDVSKNNEDVSFNTHNDFWAMVENIASQQQYGGKVDIMVVRYAIKENYTLDNSSP
ncbi:MAG: hypothetical protein IJG09_10020, partial [Methanobrevibacter sp.]|nr:hypothetical protein [Methanobrevibacter sp.]